jgi:hypothetical protein
VLVHEPLRAEMQVRWDSEGSSNRVVCLTPTKSKAHCASSRKTRPSKSAKTGAASLW